MGMRVNALQRHVSDVPGVDKWLVRYCEETYKARLVSNVRMMRVIISHAHVPILPSENIRWGLRTLLLGFCPFSA